VYYVKSDTQASERAIGTGEEKRRRIPKLALVLEPLQDSGFIVLSKAVARAHSRLFPEDSYKDPRTLQVIALALTELMPMYWRDARTGERHQLTEVELSAAQFTKGIMELISVPTLRFEAALEMMQMASLDQARASLTLRQSPRAISAR